MKWFKLEGYLILKSSQNRYHVVFNRQISMPENMRIMSWIALQSHNLGLHKWFLMQCIMKSSTLRVSNKRENLHLESFFDLVNKTNKSVNSLKIGIQENTQEIRERPRFQSVLGRF